MLQFPRPVSVMPRDGSRDEATAAGICVGRSNVNWVGMGFVLTGRAYEA